MPWLRPASVVNHPVATTHRTSNDFTDERSAGVSTQPTKSVAEIDIDSIDLGGRRSPWPYLFAGLIIGGATVWAGGRYLDNNTHDNAVTEEVVELATTEVRIQTLTEEVEWTGTLGYGEAVQFGGPGGTITGAPDVGSVLVRGDTLATVDNEKVIVVYGSTPLYRTLREGVVGPDVQMLESNLVELGYDPDVTVTIDDEFTYNTAVMVERWQTDLGNEVTGEVAVGDAAVVLGPVSVSAISGVGQTAGPNMATLEPRRTQTDVVSQSSGAVANMVPVGAAIDHGTTLYSLDEIDVVAIATTDSVSVALTGGTYTIEALERALSNGGFALDGEMTVDGIATASTISAVERWQSEVGLPVSSQTSSASYQFVEPGQVVDSHAIADGTILASGRPVMSASASELSVVVTVSVSDETEFSDGQSVLVTLADETQVEGIVAEIGAVTQSGNDPTIDVVINIIAAPDVTLVEGPVTVTTVSSEIIDALVVPTRALVSLREGGYAVEVERNGSTQLVGIEIGSFDDGLVEVTAGDLNAGDEVVVPQ
jgi:peptidoglycan hydrolase-like protein with peptidoglycan-binding domain